MLLLASRIGGLTELPLVSNVVSHVELFRAHGTKQSDVLQTGGDPPGAALIACIIIDFR
jgi:hypothetical protein